MEAKKRVAIIGAGVSGLSAIKCCLDEELEPVCFERTHAAGGLWRYTEEPVDGQGCVMKSTVINTSKEMMSYSDFPIPSDYPPFMHNTQVHTYLLSYSTKFGLEKHIRYKTSVLGVKRADNFARYGQWEVKSLDHSTEEEKTEIFDFVLVCTGHHAEKYEPTFPGLSNFKGKVLHSHDYRHPKGMENKRVLVIGIGNSGGDIATEMSRYSSQVFLSTRQGTWIFHRVSDSGLPLDMLYTNRALRHARQFAGGLVNMALKMKLNWRIDHELYCLKPRYEPLQQHPMVNDDMPNRIICGSIQIKTDVKQFTETGVQFIDGTTEENIDIVFLATGYSFGFPFIEKEVIDVKDNEINMYKNMFIPDLQRQTLAIIGCVQGFGAISPAAEMQCRAATRVFKRESYLPSCETMLKDIRKKKEENAKTFVKSRRHTIQVEVIDYMDELADICGCSVDMGCLLRTDPVLAFKVFFGPITPYQFRLFGPGKWDGAREAIMTQWDRIYKPLATRPLPPKNNGAGFISHPVFTFILAFSIYMLFRYLFL